MGIYVLAITGASGSRYASLLADRIVTSGHKLKVIISGSGREVIEQEESISLSGNIKLDRDPFLEWIGVTEYSTQVELVDERNVGASIASGSFQHNGMIVIPCSGGTLGRISNGISSNVIDRAALVCLKERRKIILVTRETPLGLIDIENMRKATEAGAILMPASPGFYHKPETINDLISFIVDRILDHLGIENQNHVRWVGKKD
jgi:4-hydroxy-3-polyprenylbenzoate decarboxylase